MFKIFRVRLSVCGYVCDLPIIHIDDVLNDVIGKTLKNVKFDLKLCCFLNSIYLMVFPLTRGIPKVIEILYVKFKCDHLNLGKILSALKGETHLYPLGFPYYGTLENFELSRL